MKYDAYLSTGEAAQASNVSRSTIARKFDLGILQGKINPITRERMISRESLRAFMEAHGLRPPDAAIQRRVLVASAAEAVPAGVKAWSESREGICVNGVVTGADALVFCAQHQPDLLIIDASLPDLSPTIVVAALRRQAQTGHQRIAVLGLSDEPELPETVAWGADHLLPMQVAQDATQLTGHLDTLLGLRQARVTEPELFEHKRRWPRLAVNLPARVAVYATGQPQRSVWGTARVRNLSRSGALLQEIHIQRTDVLSGPFRMTVALSDPSWEGWQANCRVIRLQSNGLLNAGVQFLRISRKNIEQIARLESMSLSQAR